MLYIGRVEAGVKIVLEVDRRDVEAQARLGSEMNVRKARLRCRRLAGDKENEPE